MTPWTKIQAAYTRLDELRNQRGEGPGLEIVLDEALKELGQILDSWNASAEELDLQQDQIANDQAELETERARYTFAFDFTPDGYVVTDVDGTIREINRAAAEMLHPGQKVGAFTLVPFIVQAGRASFLELLSRFRRGITQREDDWQVTLQPRGGAAFPASLTVAAIRDAQAHLIGMRWQIRDITDRKRAEETARASEERFRVLAEAMPQIVWSADASGAVDYFNPRSYEYTGVQASDVMGWNWASVIHPDDLDATNANWRRALETGHSYALEHRVRRADGEYRWHLTRTVPARDEQGRVVRWVGTATDIHDQKLAEEVLERRVRHRTTELARANEALAVQVQERERAQEAAKAERQRLGAVLNMLPAYVVLLSPDYHVPFANRFFEERFGKSEGRRCYEYLFQRTEPCENCETYKVLKTGAPHRWEWTGPDGCDYDIYDFPFTDVDGSPLIMEVGLDITVRKRATAELEQHRQHLEEMVLERTEQLRAVNEDLHAEIEERKCIEEELAQEQANLQAVFDAANVGMLLIDERGAVRQINDTVSRWVGRDLSAGHGRQPGDLVGCIHALEDAAGCGQTPHCTSCPIRSVFESVARSGQPVHGVEALATLAVDGAQVSLWLDLSADPLELDGARHVVLAMNDITQRKVAEAALESARAEAVIEKSRLEAVMEALPVAVALTDRQGGTITSNRMFEHVWGGPAPPTRSVDDYVAYQAWWADTGKPVQPEEWASAQAIRHGNAVFGQLVEIEGFDGVRRSVMNSAVPIRDANGEITGSAVTISEVTDLRRAEEAIRRHAEELQAVNDELTRFNRVAVDRELRMIELKKQINELCAQAGQPPRYAVHSEKEQS